MRKMRNHHLYTWVSDNQCSTIVVIALPVIHGDGLAETVVVHVVSEKCTSCIAPSNDALIVEVIGTVAGLAQGRAIGVQFHLFECVEAFIAIGTAQVVARYMAFLLQHLGHVWQAYYEASSKTQYETLVSLYGSTYDVVWCGWCRRTADDIPAAGRVCDGAKFSHGCTCTIEIRYGRDGRI